MVWLQSALLYLHVLGAIFWFGSTLTFEFVIMPGLLKSNLESRGTFLDSVADGYGKVASCGGSPPVCWAASTPPSASPGWPPYPPASR